MALSAVGNRKVCVTACCCISVKASSGLKRPLYATMGRPKYSVGSKASINPPVQAQSAGDQKTLGVSGSGRPGAAPAVPAPTPALPRAGEGDVAPAVGLNPNQFWLQTNPVRLPISARCGINAPLGGPVVPLV